MDPARSSTKSSKQAAMAPSPLASAKQLNFSIPLRAISGAGNVRVGKRQERDENSSARNNAASSSPASSSSSSLIGGGGSGLSDLDLATMSPLCHQLLETKKRMLSALSSVAEDADARSDEELLARAADNKQSYKQSKLKTASGSAVTTGGGVLLSADVLTPDAILQRKAQRRREQVRAASRRCRDRQRVRLL